MELRVSLPVKDKVHGGSTQVDLDFVDIKVGNSSYPIVQPASRHGGLVTVFIGGLLPEHPTSLGLSTAVFLHKKLQWLKHTE